MGDKCPLRVFNPNVYGPIRPVDDDAKSSTADLDLI